MNFVWIHWKQSLAAELKSWRTWLLLLLLPLMSFGAGSLLPAEEAAAPVQVGVVLPQQGGEEFWAKLERRSGLAVVFLPAGEEQARQQVAAGRWDCALLLPEDFERRVDGLDTYRLITLLVGPGSAAYPVVRETVSACLAELISPQIAEDYLLDSGILTEDGLPQARERLEQTLTEEERVLVRLKTLDGGELDALELADSGIDGLLAGLTAVFLSVWALFAAMDLGLWLDGPLARRLRPLRGTTALLLPRLAAQLCPALAAGALALLALDRPGPCLLALPPYLLFWGGVTLLLARRRAVWETLPILLPFVPAAGLLLSPVLIDLSQFVPALAPVCRWMPVTLYLRACGGSAGDALLLAAVGIAAAAGQWAADHVPPIQGNVRGRERKKLM